VEWKQVGVDEQTKKAFNYSWELALCISATSVYLFSLGGDLSEEDMLQAAMNMSLESVRNHLNTEEEKWQNFSPLTVKTLSLHYNFTVWMLHKQGSFQSSGSRNESGTGGQSLKGICKYKKDCTNLENCSTPTTEHHSQE